MGRRRGDPGVYSPGKFSWGVTCVAFCDQWGGLDGMRLLAIAPLSDLDFPGAGFCPFVYIKVKMFLPCDMVVS